MLARVKFDVQSNQILIRFLTKFDSNSTSYFVFMKAPDNQIKIGAKCKAIKKCESIFRV
ncbi:hypothetical protein CAMRE0001_1541 [Campylobacter rectus RM3267]|uniref:Uncharacterized protein n=1 Tax=Campylobacter rectus RM3267 TaxID=553218 RepID=B9CZI3_CAMRE|nr:hypothetical protein CAMRE0001_1541 [Campylobacter rectus RM3267]